ncbi:CotG/ExsB N-terminal domain-containing protein [Heyndrickxia sporothermodurans]
MMTVFTPEVIEEAVDYANSAGLGDFLDQEPEGPYISPLTRKRRFSRRSSSLLQQTFLFHTLKTGIECKSYNGLSDKCCHFPFRKAHLDCLSHDEIFIIHIFPYYILSTKEILNGTSVNILFVSTEGGIICLIKIIYLYRLKWKSFLLTLAEHGKIVQNQTLKHS